MITRSLSSVGCNSWRHT